jgi:pyruvate formate lyase activating enzyme
MVIGGLQKFSLQDFPGKIAAIVFCRGCNFRCPYCHNPELVDAERYAAMIPPGEVLDFLSKRGGQLQGVVVTGGEPTLQGDLPDFLASIRDLGFAIKLDTNGSSPGMLSEILGRDLADYVAMDIKAPISSYSRVAGVAVQTKDIVESIRLLKDSPVPHEFRTTYIDSLLSIDDMRELPVLLQGCGRFVLQSFRPAKTLDEALLFHQSPTEARMKEIREMLEAAGLKVALR